MKYRYLWMLIVPLLVASCSRVKTTSSTSSSIQPQKDDVDISFVAINDFHGIVEPRNQKEVGLAKLTSYLKDKKSKGAVLLNNGDSYQDSFLAGYDKGITISKIFKDIDFDAYTIGNHEFDWGIQSIKDNEAVLGKKFLGANIYSYPEKTKYNELGELYTIKTLNEGLENQVKIGIIGVIGEKQITSITSTNVENITFVNPDPIVIELSTELKNNQGCDIVIANYHAPIDQLNAQEVSKYVDAVFLGHTHQETYDEINGVPFIQGGRYGEAASEITLTFNKKTQKVKNKAHKIQHLRDLSLLNDENASTIINNQKKITDPIGNAKIGTSSAYLEDKDMSCYYSKIIYEKAANLGYTADFVLFNVARYHLKPGEFTYSQLYETNPFQNKIYMLSVNGYTIYREALYYQRQFGYNPNNINIYELETQKNVWYDVLTYDYNGLHIGISEDGSKYYDQFAASFTPAAKHTPYLIDNIEALSAAVEKLKENPTISASDYSGNNFVRF